MNNGNILADAAYFHILLARRAEKRDPQIADIHLQMAAALTEELRYWDERRGAACSACILVLRFALYPPALPASLPAGCWEEKNFRER